jgi:hypothetical protein
MSDNLYISVNGEEISLCQTPTYVTCMCLMTSKGVKRSLKGKQAIRAFRIYIQWLKYEHQKEFNRVGGKDPDGFLKDSADNIKMLDSIVNGLTDECAVEAYTI